jgi:hypothetical protein
MLRVSLSDSCASSTTIAVISLVIEAIGSTASEFFSNSTSPEDWSCTTTADDFSSRLSAVLRLGARDLLLHLAPACLALGRFCFLGGRRRLRPA